MLNNITVVGRLTKHPQIYDKEGRKRATFTVAVERNSVSYTHLTLPTTPYV